MHCVKLDPVQASSRAQSLQGQIQVREAPHQTQEFTEILSSRERLAAKGSEAGS